MLNNLLLAGKNKSKAALRLFTRYPYLKQKPHRGNHFWAKGYCVDALGMNAEMIEKYMKYQKKQERLQQEFPFHN
ncbi:MAG: transposase [Endozoicomonas sp.]